MAFNTTSVGKSENKSNIDWDAYNEYRVKTIDAIDKPETYVGIVSQLIDLGDQDQPDSEYDFKGTIEEEQVEIEKNPSVYFKDGFDRTTKKPVRLKCVPQPPRQSVTFAVDFPDIQLKSPLDFNKEGEVETKPLRMIYGGEFYVKALSQKIIGRMIPLKVKKEDCGWTLGFTSILHKMAVDASLIKSKEVFTPQQIDEVVGKCFQFSIQAFLNKDGDRTYYNERLKYMGSLGKKDKPVEVDKFDIIQVQTDRPNDEQAIKELRPYVVNTIKLANNYEGSQIEKDFIEFRKDVKESQQEQSPKVDVVHSADDF